MLDTNVGAGILSIITESLYDNPIVVFREYVQNSMDSLLKEEDQEKCEIKIWESDGNLFFLDNGRGIATNRFYDEMVTIGGSTKKKHRNLGYKGIGRLSGVPYCAKLTFVNIYDYESKKAQLYSIDSVRYDEIKNTESENQISFSDLMEQIGIYEESIDFGGNEFISQCVNKYDDIISKTNSGFLVVLEQISPVLKNTLNADDFFENLQWLLPVDFAEDLYSSEQKDLFYELTQKNDDNIVPIRFCKISFNDQPIFRPIKKELFRDYVCKTNFNKFAVGFHTFKGDKIYIDQSNPFSGIRIYIDNMLLCDENELLQSLDHYGLLSHTLNGQIQSVRGIGAMIYITDKVSISANARRTFIEVTDNDSLLFLKLIAEFVNTVYDTRYALSNYASAKVKQEQTEQKMQTLRTEALDNLRKLAKEDVELTNDYDDATTFDELELPEQKRIIKKKISTQIDAKIKEYLKAMNSFEPSSAYEDFIEWLNKQ